LLANAKLFVQQTLAALLLPDAPQFVPFDQSVFVGFFDEFDTLVMRNQLRFFGLRGACEAMVGRLPMMTIILASCFIFCKASNSSRISGKFSLIWPVSCQPESAFVRKIARRWAASGRDPT
jgi:hypothetical protein